MFLGNVENEIWALEYYDLVMSNDYMAIYSSGNGVAVS